MRSRAGVSSARGDEVDVEPAVAVVVEQRDAAAAGLEDVVLGRAAAVGLRRQARASSKVTGTRAASSAADIGGGCRPHRRRVAAVDRFLRLRLAVAALERQPERDLAGEVGRTRSSSTQNGLDGRLHGLPGRVGEIREARGGGAQLLAERVRNGAAVASASSSRPLRASVRARRT